MKKRLLMIFAILAIAVTAMARPVDPTTASKVAQAFLKNTTGKSYAGLTDITSQTPFHEFYVFTLSSDKGFILVSADDCVVPILGYSETSRFVTEGMPAHVMDWLRTYEEQIVFHRQRTGGKEYGGSPQVRGQWTGLLNGGYIQLPFETAVSPLVTTTWNQSPYYNNLCPSIGSEQTVTGCVATATAQLMKYWNHPHTGYGSHSYTDASTGSHSVNFGATTYDWNNMPASLSSTSSSTQVNAVATLMYHIGVAIEMSYGVASTGGSGATTGSNSYSHAAANNALMTYFKYKNTLHFEEMENFTATEWSNMLRADLDASRPIIYKGRDVSGGHCFICDGYNTSGQFHFNWGWGGYCDAYYTIGQLNPTPGGTGSSASSTYNLSNGAILNIEPISNSNWSTSASTTVTLASTNTSAGSVTGAGTYYFGDTITIKATANTGNRFYGWSDGSKANPREMPATGGTVNLTANIGPLTGDTLGYCFNGYTGAWGYGNTSTDLYWGINLPGTLVANRNLNAVQVYIPSTGSYDLYICAGAGTSLTTVLANQSFTATTTGWNTITLTTPVAAGANQNLGIFIHNNGVSYPVALSSSGGTSNGFLYIAGQTPDQGYYSGGSSYSVMVRGIFDAASSDPGTDTTGTNPGSLLTTTVSNGTSTNGYVPVYGFYADAYLKAHFVYPADSLTTLDSGSTIYQMTFHASQNSVNWGSANFNVYLAETTDATISAFADVTNMTLVYTGSLGIDSNKMVITFTNGYPYGGGNLLVAVENVVEGSYVTSTWYGNALSGASVQGYNYNSLSSISPTQHNFLPKVTIGYTDPAPTTVTIGDTGSTDANSYLPMNSLYEYSYTQQIYTPTEVGGTGTITSITVWLYGNDNLYTMPFDIYMRETNKSSFSSTTDWETVTAANLVHSDSVTVHNTAYQPYTFTLNTPFYYSGNGNLLIAFDNNTGQWKSGLKGKVFGTNDNPVRAIYVRRDNTDYDPFNMTGVTANATTYQRNVIQLVIQPSASGSDTSAVCSMPDTLEATNITDNTAMMTWTGGSGTFNVEYKEATATTWTTAASNIGWNYMLVNLTAGTTYDVRVQSVCGSEVSDWKTATFTTTGGSGSGTGSNGFTICDGTATDSYVPVYGFYADAYLKAHFVYPADSLTTMGVGDTIHKLTFYATQNSVNWGSAHFNVYLAEVDNASISDYADVTDMTQVYSGSLGITDNTMVVEFDNGYTYTGGNLLVAVEEDTTGTYVTSTWNGVSANGSSVQGYSYTSLTAITATQRNFLPKVTIDYTELAPETVTIGDSTSTTTYYYLPVNMYFNYSLTQQLFTPTEVGTAGTINSIAFEYTYTSQFTMNNVQIYMKNVERTSFASNTDMESISSSDLVWTGTLSATEAGWITIELDTAFEYDGVNNLLVCCYDPTNGYPGSNYKFRTTACSGSNLAIDYYSDSYVPDLTNVNSFSGSKSLRQYRNNIRLNITPNVTSGPTCDRPDSLMATSITAHTAMLTWVAGSGAFNVEYKLASADTWTRAASNIGWNYMLVNLTPATTYDVRVQSVCNNDESLWRTTSFTTSIACPVPTGLAATLTPGNGAIATLNWTAGGTETAWVLEYGTASDFTGATSVNVTGTPTANLTGLTAESTYYARVKAVCGGIDGQSVWSGTYTFTPTNSYAITVNDGTATNGLVPIYGYWCDDNIKSTFIIPAADLAAMQYGTITKLTFYANNPSVSWGNAQFTVYMTETSATTVSGIADFTTMTQVMTAGSLSISNNIMEVTLTTPYQYMGGNLMIAFDQPTSGSFNSCNWYGVSATGASYGGYGTDVSQQNFLPKTRFDYIPGQAPACPTPVVAIDSVVGRTVWFHWTSTSDSVFLTLVNAEGDQMWGQFTVPSGSTGADGFYLPEQYFPMGYTYLYGLGFCGSDTSDWALAYIPISCDVENQCPVTFVLNDGYGDGWNGGELLIYDSISGMTCANMAANNHGLDQTLTSDTVVYNLCSDRTYMVYITPGNYPTEISFQILDNNGTVLWNQDSNTLSASSDTLGYFHLGTCATEPDCVPMLSVIGDSTSTTTAYLYPVNNYYSYTLSETIIDASEIGGPMDINSISFYYNYATAMTNKSNCTIYVQPTSKTVFSSSSDLELLDPVNAVMVYTGDLNCSQGWNTFTFTTPFHYDGVGNLMVIVDDNSNAYNNSSYTFRTTSCTGYKTLHWYSDSYNPDPTSSTFSGSKGYVQYRVVMKLDGCQGTAPSCLVPTNLAVTAGINNATLTWVDSAAASLYSVTLSDANGVVSYATTTTPSYTLTGLTPNTDYTVAVRALCSASDSSRAVTAAFHTECDLMTTLPYSYGFEGAATGTSTNPVFDADCWKRLNNGTTYFGYPYISSSTTYCHTGSRGLYWYNYSTVGTYGNYRVIVLPGVGGNYTMSDLRLTFWAKASSASAHPVFHVGVMTDPTDISTLDTVYTVNVNPEGNTDWKEYFAPLAGYTGTGRYVAIATYPEGSTWTAYVDDVTLEIAPSCLEVSNLVASAITNSSVTLTWADQQNGTGTTYTVSNATSVIASGITTTTYTVTGLTANTDYTFNVVANCSATDASPATSVTVHTECDLMTTLPYTYGFEGATTGTSTNAAFAAECWHRFTNSTSYPGYPYISSTSSYCHTGTRTLYWYCGSSTSYGDYQVVVLPGVGGTYDMSDLRVKFWAKASSATAHPVFYIGVMTDPTDISTFTQVATVNVEGTTWTEYIGNLAGYTGTGRYVAIRSNRGSSAWTAYFDDVTLEEAPSCLEVTNLTAAAMHNSVTLTWADQLNNTGTTYTVSDATNVIASGLTGTTYTVTGLTAQTSYTFYVTANCSANDASSPVSVTVTTACTPVSFPYTENFDSWTSKSSCWSFLSGAFNNGAGRPTVNSSAWTLNSTYGSDITISGKALTMNLYSTYCYWAVTPLISMTSNDAQISFDIAVAAWSAATPNFDANDTVAIAITTDGGATYTPLLVYGNTELNALSGTYTTVTVPVTGYSGQNVRFAIFGGSTVSGGDNRVVIDNVSVSEVPGCWPLGVVIGNEASTTTSYYYPVNNYYGYSLSETIIDEAEIGGAMPINGIRYYYNAASAMTGKTNCTIYLQPTTKTTFSSSSDIELLDSTTAVMVYTGSLNCSQGWNDFTFTTPYNYSGTGNLMVIVDDNSGTYNSTSHTFRTSSCTGNKTLYWYSDSYNPDPATSTSETYSGTKSYAQYRVVMALVTCDTATCHAPLEAVASAVGINNATVTWTSSNATSYSVTLMNGTNIVSYSTTTDTVKAFTGLTANIDYSVVIRALCSASDSSSDVTVNFHTECDLVTTLPYTYGFEGATTGGSTNVVFAAECWHRHNNGTTYMGYPYIASSTTYCHSGSRGLYWYNYSTVSTYGNYRVIVLPGIGGNYTMSDLRLKFWAKASSATAHPVFHVGVMTDPTDISTLDTVYTVNVNPEGTTDWHEYYAYLAGYTGTGRYVAIASYPEGTTWTAYFDDVTLEEAPSCTEVSNLAVAGVTTSSVTLTWTDALNTTGTTYTVSNAQGVTLATGITATTYTVTGLTANTDYTFNVVANCSASEASGAMSVTAHTECELMTTLPYTYGFEGATVGTSTNPAFAAECWHRFTNSTSYPGYPYISSTSSYCHTGTRALYWYCGSSTTYGDYQVAVLPGVGGTYDMNHLKLKFWAKASSTSYHPVFVIGIMSDPTDISTFTQVATVNVEGTTYTEYEALLASYTGSGRYVAIRSNRGSSAWTAYFDDVTLEEVSGCQPVTNLAATVADNSVTLTWSDPLNTGATYTVSGGNGTIASGLTTTSYTVTGLTPNTDYSFSVVANCSADVASDSASIAVHTECTFFTTLPYTMGFETADGVTSTGGSTSTTFIDCWHRLNNGTQYFGYPYVATTSSYIHTGARGLYWANSTTTGTYGDYQCIVLPGLGGNYAMDGLQLKFWARATSTTYHPVLYVGVMTNPSDINSFVYVDTINVEGTTYTEYTSYLNNYTGTGRYVAIRANRPTSTWYLSMDDITLDVMPSCFPVTNLTIASTTTSSMTLTWNDNFNSSATYTVSNAEGTVIASNVTGSSYTVTGLNAGTEYTFMVTSNCSATDSGETVSVTGYTACATLTANDLPYTEDFESYGSGSAYPIHPCWTKGTNGSTAYPYPTSTAAAGTRSLYFYGYKPSTTTGTHVYSYAALPQLDATLDASDLTLSFKARRYSTVSVSYRSIIYVGVMTNPTDASTFVAVDTINMTPLPASTIETYNVILANYTGTGKYVAFYCPWIDTNTSYSYNYIYIDDVMLDITPTCLPVADITASNATTNSVTLSWTDAYNTGATYTVYDMSDSTVMGTGITGTTYTVTGLAPSTSYSFGIQANCSANDASPIMTVATRTACGVATMPWVETFDNWTAKSDCWEFLSGAFNNGAGTPTASTAAWTLNNTYGDHVAISGKALTMNIYSTNRYWAVTPAISITSNRAKLTFDVAVAAWSGATPNYDANDTLAIAITTDSGLTYTPLLVYGNTQLNALGNTYTTITVPVTGYNGQEVRFAIFGGSTASGGDNRVVVDNVSVTALDSTVFAVAVNDTAMGTVLPHTGNIVYYPGDSVNITAVPNTGYLFDYWVASMDNNDTMHHSVNPIQDIVSNGDAGHTYHLTAVFKCEAVSFPFSENFESGTLSNCWTVDGPGTWTVGTGDYTLATGAHTGTYNAKITHTNYDYVTKLITPAIDFTGVTAAELRFWHLQRSWAGDQDELRVYYRTSSTAAWQQLAAYTSEITAYTEEIIQLPNLSSTYQVAFEFTDGYGYGVALDDITINVPPSCTAVTALTATPTDNSVALTWSDANTSATYTVYNMSDTSVVATGITTTSYTVTGLLANTLYTFGVVANCSASDASQFTSVTVRTNCSAFTVPYTWTFEDMDVNAAPLCWAKVGSGTTNVLSSTSNSHNSSKYLRFSGSTSNLIVLPEIADTISNLQMRLWTRPESVSNSSCGTFSVGYVTDPSDATTFVALDTYTYNSFTAYEEKTVRYNGVPTGARMALRHTPNSASWYWYVDDVTVEQIPACPTVEGLVVTGVTLNSVSLQWNSVAGATSYTVYDMADSSVIAASVNDTVYTVTGLTAETNYTFGVLTNCSATSSAPYPTTVNAFTGYCQPSPTSVDASGITSVSFGGMTNDATRPSTAGYRNYSNLSGSVATGSTATVDITYATGYTYGTIIWVDWDNSLTFDSNEVVYVGTSSNTNPTTLTCTFTIPATQALGRYRMRILGADSYFDSYTGSIAAAAGANPCATYTWGVAEDYTLAVVAPSTCPTVTGVAVTGVTNNSVSLQWNAVSGATYTVYNDTAVVATGITDTFYTVTGLTANTSYVFGVEANCSATSASAYPVTVTARTLCNNANLPFVESFEANSATRDCWTLDYPAASNAISYVTFDGHTALRFSSYATATDYNQYAYSPVFNTPTTGDSLHVRVRYATYGANDSLWFGFRMANSNDFTWTPTAYNTHYNDSTEIAYLDATLPINTVQLAIHYYGNYAYYAWIDSVELRVATEAPQVIVYDTTTVTACDTYTWHGTAYTTSGVIVDSTSSNDTVFVLNLTVNYSTTGSATVATCDSLVWNGNTYTQSGIFSATLTAANGCDSVVTLNLTVNPSVATSNLLTVCDSYYMNDSLYTASTTIVEHLTTLAGCDSTATLALTVNYSTTHTDTAIAVDSYTWHGGTYTVSGVYTDTLTNLAGCDSICYLDLTVSYTSLVLIDSIVACDSYTWRGTTYTASTVAHDTVVNATGADSVYILVLNVNYSQRVNDTVTACDSYTWHGTNYTASATAVDTLQTVAGCDSICTLTLTVNQSVLTRETLTECDSYTWNGTVYTASTVDTAVFAALNGCDSTVILNLTVNYSTTHNDTATAVDSYTWHGNTYVVSGVYTDTLTNLAGCDSICYLDLTVTYTSPVRIDSALACDSYTWRGTTYTASTVAHDTVHNATGTDSVYILVLTVNYSQRANDTVMACDSYTWHGTTYTASATAVDTIQTVAGCDSICTLTLTVNQSVLTRETLTECDSYTWNGTVYTASTVDTAVFAALNGCDSTVILNLTVNYSTTHNDTATAVDSYTWHGNTYVVSGVYTDTLPNAAGCDSICTLDLTVTYSTLVDIDTVAACDSYTWRGTTYTASTVATDTVDNATGADSVYILVLTVNHSQLVNDTVMACDSYTWHGTTYTANATAVDTLQTVAGCDSICTLTLTVNHSTTGTAVLTGCDSILWNDTWYTSSAIVVDTMETTEGCDSIVAVTLVINQSVTTTETVTACDSYEWNGTVYTASTVDTLTFAALNGCDSTVVLNLTVNYSVENFDTVSATDSYTWHGTVYDRSGEYHDTLTAFNGCDSVETLVLTIAYNAAAIDTIVACDSATWHGRTYYASIVARDTLPTISGGDSVIVLLLTINNSVYDTFTVITRVPYLWHDSVYSVSGVYTYYGQTAAGCDHVETLYLTIDTTQEIYYSVAVVVANTEGLLNVGGTVEGAGSYLAGTVVTLTATPDSGYLFNGWYTRSSVGFGGELITTDDVYTVTLDSNIVLVAMFERIGANSALLTVAVDSTMGYVLFNDQPVPYNIYRGTLGDTVTLTAVVTDDNCEFLGWVNAAGDTLSRENVYQLVLEQATTSLTAAFVRHEGIADIDASSVTIFAREHGVVVRGAAQQQIYIFDVVGRLAGHVNAAADEEFIRLSQTGVYLVKVGNLPARRVLVRE